MALPGTGQSAPTVPGTTAAPAASQVVPVIPFTRAARKKSALLTQFPNTTLATTVTSLSPVQVIAAGYLKRIKLTVTGTTSGNSATVAFNADGPFNIITQFFFNQPNGASIIQPIEGFDLFALNKYGAFNTGTFDPLSDPSYFATTGSGATGGSFNFTLYVPIEVDARDGLGALANMAANQSYLLQFSLNTIANLYSTAPTTAPVISIVATMEYYSAPAAMTPATATSPAQPQQVAPTPIGSLNLIQVQQPPINPSSAQKLQIVNMGNVVRFFIFILRNSSGVRTETDWPASVNIKFLGDVMFYKTKQQWILEQALGYRLFAGKSAAPTLNSLDNGVYVLTDFMTDGGAGDGVVSASNSRDIWLPTQSSTLLEFEALTAWGSGASTLKILQNCINPSSAAALYHPFVS